MSLETRACRDRYWESVGASEAYELGYLISPVLLGGPAWPSLRPGYRVVRTADSIILATEGLSDPFDEGDGTENGFGMELFLETRDIEPKYAGTPGDVGPLVHSWALLVVQQIAGAVADAGGITPELDRYGVLSIDLPGFGGSDTIVAQIPSRFLTEAGELGALLGLKVADRAGEMRDPPLSPIRLVSITLLTAAELERVRTGGDEAREAIAAALSARRDGHFSDLGRASTV